VGKSPVCLVKGGKKQGEGRMLRKGGKEISNQCRAFVKSKRSLQLTRVSHWQRFKEPRMRKGDRRKEAPEKTAKKKVNPNTPGGNELKEHHTPTKDSGDGQGKEENGQKTSRMNPEEIRQKREGVCRLRPGGSMLNNEEKKRVLKQVLVEGRHGGVE